MTAVLVAGAAVCDRSCYDAGGPDCTCVCGGANHGVGRALAGHWPLWLEGNGQAVRDWTDRPTGPTRCVDDASLVDGLRLLMGPVRLVSGRHSGGRMSFGSRWRWTTANGWPGGCGSDCWHRTPEAAMDCFRAPPNAMAARR